MYQPPAFRIEELPAMQEVMRQARLASLVTAGPDGLWATPLPLVLEEGGRYGTLLGHVAKANTHWQIASGYESLVIFNGPEAYITPSWYKTKNETGKVVPTWNYVAVHAYGTPEFFDDDATKLDAVEKLTRRHEDLRPAPWAVSDAPAPFVAGQLKGIVGFRLRITRLEGKRKMSQNRTQADRAGVSAGLRAEGLGDIAGLVSQPP